MEISMNITPASSSELTRLFPDKLTQDFILDLMHALPNIVAVLNEDRRLVFSNQAMLDSISITNFEDAFQLRPGDIFQCVNAELEPGGCGESEACQLCGALRAMEDSRSTKKTITNDCRILSKKEGKTIAYNFRFTSTPFFNEDSMFFVITIENKSHEKRKSELEHIFYHDVINSLSGLHGLIFLLKKKDSIDDTHINMLEDIYKNLYRTITEQKDLSLAETGELSVKSEMLNSLKIVEETILPFKLNSIYLASVELKSSCCDVNFVSDSTLLSRILTNMIKNAYEASKANSTITVGATENEGFLTFSVNNQTYINRDTQLQIFERSFSTKGKGRGLGTYSMKLLGENYLNGDVWFTTDKEKGTTFYIKLAITPSSSN